MKGRPIRRPEKYVEDSAGVKQSQATTNHASKIEGRGLPFRIAASIDPAPAETDITPERQPTGAGSFYVYVHRDAASQIFYVGKGTGERAWSEDRHPLWHKYVTKRSGGQFTVQIVSYHKTSDEAEAVEETFISRYGKQIVNWFNNRREFDYPAIERFHTARNATRLFVAETKVLESIDPPHAVERYRQALTQMYDYKRIVTERGLIAELMDDGTNYTVGDPPILDRLTLCLSRLGRWSELKAAVDDFLRRFPMVADAHWMQPILKRRERANIRLGCHPGLPHV
jgi:hypothetical protein